MKKILLTLALIACITCNAKQVNDTIPANQSDVSEWIAEKSVNSKGKEVTHYYAVYKGMLISTNKTTIEKVQLCDKYHAKCALIVIGPKVNGVIKPKRIIIN